VGGACSLGTEGFVPKAERGTSLKAPREREKKGSFHLEKKQHVRMRKEKKKRKTSRDPKKGDSARKKHLHPRRGTTQQGKKGGGSDGDEIRKRKFSKGS